MQIEYIKQLLLAAPSDELYPCLKPYVEKWDTSSLSASDVLDVLDLCKATDGASDLIINILETAHSKLQKMELNSGT
jgi:hypothetical protein